MDQYSTSQADRQLLEAFAKSRAESQSLCESLELEDFGLQAMAETSPLKWHLAHTSWFYETFVLKPFAVEFSCYNKDFEHLFNSYYNGVGIPFKRANRGLLSRPTVAEVFDYRKFVTEKILELLNAVPDIHFDEINNRCWLGIHHEKQHQELMLTDLKYNFFQNPLYPQFRPLPKSLFDTSKPSTSVSWTSFAEGLASFGEQPIPRYGQGHFNFDNETPRHRQFLNAYEMRDQVVTNREFLAFVTDHGYQDSMLWLSDGWAWRQQFNIDKPLYWIQRDGEWLEFTLYGLMPLQLDAPVCHISLYEADAFARWLSCRLPSEYEWERYAEDQNSGDLAPPSLHPLPTYTDSDCMMTVWQWTQSSYAPYPGFAPLAGAVGEYNGKFMCNQNVLRGGSCFTPSAHIRPTYRNFFYPPDRWQMTGIRLARAC